MKGGPRISVIIPVYNGAAVIAGCIEAVLSQDQPAGTYEVLVVDNGSNDNTTDVVRRYPVRLTHEPVRSSYAARNRGLSESVGEIVAFTDADCRPSRTWLSGAMECIERGVDRVGGLVLREIRDDDTPWACYDKLFFLDQERYVAQGWAATANLVTRREVFQRVGVFQVVESGGDYEWGRRAQAAQRSICYSERAAVDHCARHDFGQLAAKIRRLAAGQGREARAERRGRLSAQLMRRAVHARGLARLGVECARGRLAPSSALTLLFAWPILQVLALRSFSLGWAGAPAANVSSGCHQEIVPSWKVT